MLLLDLGNSYIKAQWWSDDSLQSSTSIRINLNWLLNFNQYLYGLKVSSCYFASVPGSEIENDLQQSLYEYFPNLKLQRLSSKVHCRGVVSAYPESTRLGIDRWLALMGAAEVTQQNAIVIDAGSAITVDLLRADGQHLGGAILPGFNTSVARFKDILSVADFDHAEIQSVEEPGCSTESCIHINYQTETGIYLNQLIQRWAGLLADDAILIVSGGDAERVVRHVDYDYRLIPDLVFRGMRRQLETLE